VARVTLDGVEPKEIDIELVLSKIREHSVDVGELIQQLQSASSNLVLGQVEHGGLRFSARAVGEFTSVEEIGNLVVNDQGLRIKDIAEITYEEPPYVHGRHLDLDYAVALEVYKESTANTVDVVRDVMTVIQDDINADPLLQGVNLFVWEDQGKEITGGLTGLLRAGTLGALLAVFFKRLALGVAGFLVGGVGLLWIAGETGWGERCMEDFRSVEIQLHHDGQRLARAGCRLAHIGRQFLQFFPRQFLTRSLVFGAMRET